jgi:predicted RNase H-like nuclease (RuvC/YqgF family)
VRYAASKEISTLQHKIEQLQKENRLLRKWVKDKEKIIEILQVKGRTTK